MNNISGYGIQVSIRATYTFPVAFSISQFADDVDPVDLPSVQIADKAMGVNGDLITWSKANPLLLNIGVVPSSSDDQNLSILFEANRPGRAKLNVQDTITATINLPDGSIFILNNGIITDGMPGNSVASAGRYKSKVYSFAFENYITGL